MYDPHKSDSGKSVFLLEVSLIFTFYPLQACEAQSSPGFLLGELDWG